VIAPKQRANPADDQSMEWRHTIRTVPRRIDNASKTGLVYYVERIYLIEPHWKPLCLGQEPDETNQQK